MRQLKLNYAIFIQRDDIQTSYCNWFSVFFRLFVYEFALKKSIKHLRLYAIPVEYLKQMTNKIIHYSRDNPIENAFQICSTKNSQFCRANKSGNEFSEKNIRKNETKNEEIKNGKMAMNIILLTEKQLHFRYAFRCAFDVTWAVVSISSNLFYQIRNCLFLTDN